MNPPSLSTSNPPASEKSPLYQETLAYLHDRINYETFRSIPYDNLEKRLGRLRLLLDELGTPDKNYPIIHVAGTKGKGSTCVFLEQILRHAGYRVGRFSSPHLHSLMERFTINGVPCDQEHFATILFELKERLPLLEKKYQFDGETQNHLTFFDLTTIFAFEYFAREKVDFAIVEVGLGGRLDSTNVCRSDLAIITSISFDHIEQLGPTLADIAKEKAGIIKAGVPVVSGVRSAEPAESIRQTATAQQSPLYEIEHDFSYASTSGGMLLPDEKLVMNFDFATKPSRFVKPRNLRKLKVSAWGEHQARNASVAVAAASLLDEKGWTIPEQAIRDGLRSVQLPARVEVLANEPLIVVDGAHNRVSVQYLIETLQIYCPKPGKKILLFGSMLGKDNEGMLQELVKYFDWIIFTQHPNNPRAFPAQGLYNIASSWICEDADGLLDGKSSTEKSEVDGIGEVIPDVRKALAQAFYLATPDDLVCTTGSFYLAADIRKLILDADVK